MLNNLYVNPWGVAVIISIMVIIAFATVALVIADHKINKPN